MARPVLMLSRPLLVVVVTTVVLIACGGEAVVQPPGGSGGTTASSGSGGTSTGGTSSSSGTGGTDPCEGGCTPPVLCGEPADPCSCECVDGEKWILGSVVHVCAGGCLQVPGEDLCAAPCDTTDDCATGVCAMDSVVGCKRCWTLCDGLDCPTENTCISDDVCGDETLPGFCVCDAYGCTLCMIP